jgi:hypothetical protein
MPPGHLLSQILTEVQFANLAVELARISWLLRGKSWWIALHDMVAVAENDALIAMLEAKYRDNFWAPDHRHSQRRRSPRALRTRAAARQHAMHLEYPRAHCMCGAALAAAIEALFGPAEVPELTLTSTIAQE